MIPELGVRGSFDCVAMGKIESEVKQATSKNMYTVRHKKLLHSYWYNNFAKLWHTMMIFGT